MSHSGRLQTFKTAPFPGYSRFPSVGSLTVLVAQVQAQYCLTWGSCLSDNAVSCCRKYPTGRCLLVTMLYFRYSITGHDHMALSTADRQRLYRERIRRGELRRFQFALPLETSIKVDYLCDALQCNGTELFSRLILAEWKRQGEPVSD